MVSITTAQIHASSENRDLDDAGVAALFVCGLVGASGNASLKYFGDDDREKCDEMMLYLKGQCQLGPHAFCGQNNSAVDIYLRERGLEDAPLPKGLSKEVILEFDIDVTDVDVR